MRKARRVTLQQRRGTALWGTRAGVAALGRRVRPPTFGSEARRVPDCCMHYATLLNVHSGTRAVQRLGMHAAFRRSRANSGRNQPNLAASGPTLAGMGPKPIDFGRKQSRPTSANLARIRPKWIRFPSRIMRASLDAAFGDPAQSMRIGSPCLPTRARRARLAFTVGALEPEEKVFVARGPYRPEAPPGRANPRSSSGQMVRSPSSRR